MALPAYQVFFIPKADYDYNNDYDDLVSAGYQTYAIDSVNLELFGVKESNKSFMNRYYQNFPNPSHIEFYLKFDSWLETNVIYSTENVAGKYLNFVVWLFDISGDNAESMFAGILRPIRKYQQRTERVFLNAYDFIDLLKTAGATLFLKTGTSLENEAEISGDNILIVDDVKALDLSTNRDYVRLIGNDEWFRVASIDNDDNEIELGQAYTPETSYEFTVEGVSVAPTAGSKYYGSGIPAFSRPHTIVSTDIDENGDGTILTTSNTTDPSEGEVQKLTLYEGDGDTIITYTAWERKFAGLFDIQYARSVSTSAPYDYQPFRELLYLVPYLLRGMQNFYFGATNKLNFDTQPPGKGFYVSDNFNYDLTKTDYFEIYKDTYLWMNGWSVYQDSDGKINVFDKLCTGTYSAIEVFENDMKSVEIFTLTDNIQIPSLDMLDREADCQFYPNPCSDATVGNENQEKAIEEISDSYQTKFSQFNLGISFILILHDTDNDYSSLSENSVITYNSIDWQLFDFHRNRNEKTIKTKAWRVT